MLKDIVLKDGQLAAKLTAEIQNHGQSMILRVNNSDYPIAIDLIGGKLTIYIWPTPGVSKAIESYDLSSYLTISGEDSLPSCLPDLI